MLRNLAMIARLGVAIAIMVAMFTLFKDNKIYSIVEMNYSTNPATVMSNDGGTTIPRFNGGSIAMEAFVINQFDYENIDKEVKTYGKILLKHYVNEEGNIDSVKVLRGIHPQYDAEAVRVALSMPKWIPAEKEGKKIAGHVYTHITFPKLRQ